MSPSRMDLSILCHGGLGSLEPENCDTCLREMDATPTVLLRLMYQCMMPTRGRLLFHGSTDEDSMCVSFKAPGKTLQSTREGLLSATVLQEYLLH